MPAKFQYTAPGRRLLVSVTFRQALGAVFAVTLALLLTACTMSHTAYQTQHGLKRMGFAEQQRTGRTQSWVLPANSTVYVAWPQVDAHLGQELPRLQTGLALEMEQQLARIFNHVASSPMKAGQQESWQQALNGGFTVLLVPRVAGFAANSSNFAEWMADSGTTGRQPSERGCDRLQLIVAVYDVQSGRMLDSVRVNGKSGFWSFDREEPGELAAGAVKALTGSLAAGPSFTRQD